MTFSDVNFPKQRISYDEKIANDNAWGRRVIDLLILTDNSNGASDLETRYTRMLSSYQLYNNIINQADFEKDCNPLGIEVGQFQDEIKPYNKTPNKINALLGRRV